MKHAEFTTGQPVPQTMSRVSQPYPSPWHVRMRVSDELALIGVRGWEIEEALSRACATACAEHDAARATLEMKS